MIAPLTGALGPLGRARGAAAFDPLTVAGLRAWWEADSLAVADGASVASWADSSGNGYTATAAGTAQPTYRATGGPNSKPALEFDGTTDTLTIAPPAINDGAIFVVAQPNITNAYFGYYDRVALAGYMTTAAYASIAWRLFVLTKSGGTYAIRVNGAGVAGQNHTRNAFDYPSTRPFLGYTDPATNHLMQLLYATQQAPNLAGTPPSAYWFKETAKRIGRMDMLGADWYYGGSISEILIYDSVVSSPDLTALETYLLAKYAL